MINSLGIDLGDLEKTILTQLRTEVSPVDIALLRELPVAVWEKDQSIIHLRDIARTERAWIDNPQGEVNGEPYRIQLSD